MWPQPVKIAPGKAPRAAYLPTNLQISQIGWLCALPNAAEMNKLGAPMSRGSFVLASFFHLLLFKAPSSRCSRLSGLWFFGNAGIAQLVEQLICNQ